MHLQLQQQQCEPSIIDASYPNKCNQIQFVQLDFSNSYFVDDSGFIPNVGIVIVEYIRYDKALT